MEIPAHKKRFVMLAAFSAYERTLAAARKANESAHCTNVDVDEKSVILESLKAEYSDMDGQLTLDGTPLGDQMAVDYYRDDDGTSLTADTLDRWLQDTAGADVPMETIAGWTLDLRKLVAAWLRAIEINLGQLVADKVAETGEPITRDQNRACIEDARRTGRSCAPSFVDTNWFTVPAALTDEEAAEWMQKGPWGIVLAEAIEGQSADDAGSWELVKHDEAGQIVDRSTGMYATQAEAQYEAGTRNRVHDAIVTAPAEVANQLAAEGDSASEGTEPAPEPDISLHPDEGGKPRTRGKGRKGGK